jgi:predicted transposase YdaD
MDACEPLKEYAWLVDTVRRYQNEKMDLDAAVDAAIDEMPDEYVIKPFLLKNKAEVKNMFLTEYDEKKVLEMEREEGRVEGRVEGKEDATVSSLQTIMKKMKLSAEKAMDFMDIPPEDQPKYALLLRES